MELNHWPNLVSMFVRQAQTKGDAPFLWAKHGVNWKSTTWNEALKQVECLATSLRLHGLQNGGRVVLVADNSPEWAIAAYAIMAAGGITVPAYVTNTLTDHKHILVDSGATIAIVSTKKLAQPLLEAAEQTNTLSCLIAIEPLDRQSTSKVQTIAWDEALSAVPQNDPLSLDEVDKIKPEDVACLIYTSGTGGTPKGVMLSHRAIMCNCVGAYYLLEELGLDDEIFLSFLPLSHSYEHSCGLMFPISIGAQIYYAEGIDKLSSNLTEVSPTIMTSVPRLYEVMRLKILDGVRRTGGLKEKLFTLTLNLGQRAYNSGSRLPPFVRFLDTLMDKLVRNKVRGRFGGRLKAMVSGGAPLNLDVGIFFTSLGLRLLQGYGQTETAPVVSCNPSSNIKLDTVGPPLKHVQVRIANDGEILVKGPLLMNGYWRQPEITNETIRDGWLHTGDIGEIDEDGYIRITDRKKDIIVLSGGDNVSPQRVEGILCLEPEIEQAIVVGDKRRHLAAILVPSTEFLDTWTKSNSRSGNLVELHNESKLHEALSTSVGRANKKLSVIEQVRRFGIAEHQFSVENEMLTPTMKNRRHQIIDYYQGKIDSLYEK